METFNPKILDASIRDVSSYLTDNQKVDLLLYAMRCLQIEGRSRTVIENAIQSCLQVSTLSPEIIAKARIMRARARLAGGSPLSAQEDLQAALAAEPDNHEAKALLHQRSVTVERLLAPLPRSKERISNEIWREIVLYLPRRDLKSLLFVPHTVSRIASQLLFWELDLHFGSSTTACGSDDGYDGYDQAVALRDPEDLRHAQRSADILTRIITDPIFASAVRTLRIFASKNDAGMAFQTGMLTNALPKLINLRNVHLSATSEGILRILETCSPRLRGLSLQSLDDPADLSFLDLRHLLHLAYATAGGNPVSVNNLISQNRNTLRTLALESPQWPLPIQSLSIRNLTAIYFTGHFPATSHAFAEILSNGRQLETLHLECCSLECNTAASQFRSVQHTHPLPFLRHFVFAVHSVPRRGGGDKDLFPAIMDFLKERRQLKSLQLIANDESVQQATGFGAKCWGVLVSLKELGSLGISYPSDLAFGLVPYLIPQSVKALGLFVGHSITYSQDPIEFLSQIRNGMPPGLRFVDLHDLNPRHPAIVVEHGFPMVRVLRVGGNYYTVLHNVPPSISYLSTVRGTDTPPLPPVIVPSPSKTSSTAFHSCPSSSTSGSGGPPGHISSGAAFGPPTPQTRVIPHYPERDRGRKRDGEHTRVPRGHSHDAALSNLPSVTHHHTHGHTHGLPSLSLMTGPPAVELEAWPKRRVAYHASEWLEWLGCEDAVSLIREGVGGLLGGGGKGFER